MQRAHRPGRPAARTVACGLSASQFLIFWASVILGSLSAVAVIIVVRSGALSPGVGHGSHPGEVAPAGGSIRARLVMLERAVRRRVIEVEREAERELSAIGGYAVRSGAHVDPKPSEAPGSGGAGAGLVAPAEGDSSLENAAVPVPRRDKQPAHIRAQADAGAGLEGPGEAGEGDGAEDPKTTDPRADGGPPPAGAESSVPADDRIGVIGGEADNESGGEGGAASQAEAGSTSEAAGGGEDWAGKGAGSADGGSFVGPARGRELATCAQVETDGRLRLRPRARLGFDHLIPRNRWAEVSSATPKDCPQRPGRDYAAHPVTIFQPGRGGGKVPDGRFDCPAGRILPCPFGCFLTGDESRRATADVTLSVVPGASAEKSDHCPLQKQALFSMENEVYYPNLQLTDGNMRTFDFFGTTKLSSDVPLGYGGWYDFNFLEPPRPKTAGAMAVAVISNCAAHNGRLDYIRRLVKAGVTVHQMGRCDHNFDWKPPSGQSRGRFVDKIDMLRPYKFTLAFENTNHADYVTEKYFQPLVAGSVPVYMGAQNSELYAPAPHSVIRTDDFPTAEALAAYLVYLAENEEAYNALLEWKYAGVSPGFQRAMAATTDVHSQCRLCRLVRETLEVETGDRAALSDDQMVEAQTKEEAPGAVPRPGWGV